MKSMCYKICAVVSILIIMACSEEKTSKVDIINDPFLESQDEIRSVVKGIALDAETANLEGLTSIHLDSDKFTKFGPRKFERQDAKSTNASEAAHFGSAESLKMEIKDLKVDVFGDVGIATYYPHVTSMKDGEPTSGSGRQTLVFVKTEDGWKIVHEHGTIKQQ